LETVWKMMTNRWTATKTVCLTVVVTETEGTTALGTVGMMAEFTALLLRV
jgi:hypothetical protein